ncbi:hypothetical protein HCH_00604 [Hahella chejuensis KCTC 2396]|uniref:EamA domain-containing protein n=1 Tax=Hahella chejuensis (strain KCTC 2396) TaxID=349521 RepID=Q2SPB7_HAHCH|nr:EamA family transporter [Hahella chejuensis]ABC27507.1 hypothetical protein HCH_00604 [Hahella chejuensis KCTC 2396]
MLLTAPNISYLLGLGVIATFVPNMLNNLSSMKLNPTVHNIIGMSTPISASIMAWIFLGEEQDALALIAMLVTVSGIFLSMRTPVKKPVAATEQA